MPAVTHDRAAALILAALAAGYLWETGGLQSPVVTDPLGPAAFPTLLGVSLLVLAGWLLGVGARDGPGTPTPPARRRAFLLVPALLAYAALLVPAGYLLSTGAFLLAGLCLLGEPGRRALPLAAVGAGVLWGLFARVLKLSLPVGWLFGGL